MGECSTEDLARAHADRSNFSCTNRGEAIGLTVTVEAGLLSLLTIVFVFLKIANNVKWRKRHLPTASLQIFYKPMDILMASLLLADVVQGIGAVLSLKWVQAGGVEVGTFCTAQGIIKILGATTVALSTLAIAVYTFIGVWTMKNITSMKFTLGVVVTLWTFTAALVTAALALNRNKNFSFMGPTPYWCWVNKYEVGHGWKLAVEYLWMWVALGFSLLIYFPLYLWMSGHLVINDRTWYIRFRADGNPETKTMRRRSLIMLAYPAVYCVCVIPLSAVRWKSFMQGHSAVPPPATFTAVSLFGLSGFFNAVLLLKTRPSSGLFGQLMFAPLARLPELRNNMDQVDTDLGRLPDDPEFTYRRS